MKILNRMDIKLGQYSCYFSSIFNVLNYYGYEVTESDAYFLCDGTNITYKGDLNYIGHYSYRDFLDNSFLDNLVEIEYVTDYSEQSCIYHLTEALLQNCCPILNMTPSCLDYDDVFKKSSIIVSHSLIVYGIDSQGSLLNVADSYFEDNGVAKKYTGVMPLNKIKDGIKEFIVIKPRKARIDKTDIINSFVNSLKRYLYAESDSGWRRGEAVRQYVTDLKEREVSDDQTLCRLCVNIIISVYSGIVPMLGYIKSAVKTHYPKLSDYMSCIDSLIIEWNKITLRVSKAKMRLDKNKLLLAINDMPDLLSRQNEHLIELYKEIGSNALIGNCR